MTSSGLVDGLVKTVAVGLIRDSSYLLPAFAAAVIESSRGKKEQIKMGGRRRSRSESMIKIEQQKKQSKLWFEEANNQVKSDNLEKALTSYSKVSST
ncbi:hypothetical protein QE152_g10912 [Popillia japonica]|uniref:Uncharacterized protein n=1 Tax=Popillia japonica TaxID=7064 RepID=A0AAW1LSB5_POPJA